MHLLLQLNRRMLFIVILAIPLFAHLYMLDQIINEKNPLALLILIMVLTSVIAGIGVALWMYKVVMTFNHHLPDNLKMKTGIFNYCVVFLFMYVVYFMMAVLVLTFPQYTRYLEVPIVGMIVPAFLVSLGCYVYMSWVTAKILKTMELQRPTVNQEVLREFILIIFMLVGIWNLQPRVNRLYEAILETRKEAVI